MRDQAAVSAMLCPICKVSLTMSERQGVEIDYCPQCRGVWLDRGELDKILERSAAAEQAARPQAAAQQPAPPPPQQQGYGQPWGQAGHHHHGGHHGYPYKRKKSFLEDLFD